MLRKINETGLGRKRRRGRSKENFDRALSRLTKKRRESEIPILTTICGIWKKMIIIIFF